MLQKLVPQSAGHASRYAVELVFVRDAEIAVLNRQYLDCQGPTNCLAFPDAGCPGAFFEGSLFVSLDALYRESMLYGQAPTAYLRRLLAHGLSHLAGFEHGKKMETLCAKLEECRE
jgi:probable rRNA maturation factor